MALNFIKKTTDAIAVMAKNGMVNRLGFYEIFPWALSIVNKDILLKPYSQVEGDSTSYSRKGRYN